MGIDIRLPQITDPSEKGQLAQIKSYLFQLAEQLQWALNNVDTSNNITTVVMPTPTSLASEPQGLASPEATFESIKALIIKSADIVDAYYEEISKKLVGSYVAQSDFGAFIESTIQDIEANSTNIDQTYTHLQEIRAGVDASLGELSDEVGQLDTNLKNANTNLDAAIQALKKEVQDLNFALVEVTAKIRAGLLDTEDGIPVYGLEVGQKNVIDGVEVFNKFARFTAGRLSFYDQNGAEVAYISDYKLYITHAEVTGSLKLGGYLVDTTNGLAFKWVGRG